MVTLKQVKQDPQVEAFMKRADRNLDAMGYTEHGHRHCGLVASIAYNILERLAFCPHRGAGGHRRGTARCRQRRPATTRAEQRHRSCTSWRLGMDYDDRADHGGGKTI